MRLLYFDNIGTSLASYLFPKKKHPGQNDRTRKREENVIIYIVIYGNAQLSSLRRKKLMRFQISFFLLPGTTSGGTMKEIQDTITNRPLGR